VKITAQVMWSALSGSYMWLFCRCDAQHCIVSGKRCIHVGFTVFLATVYCGGKPELFPPFFSLAIEEHDDYSF